MTDRETSRAIGITSEILMAVLIGSVVAVFAWKILWPWFRDWTAADLLLDPGAVHAIALKQERATSEAHAEAARRYAEIVVACLNEQRITDGERVVQCRAAR